MRDPTLATIVPAPAEAGGPMRTQGTRVVMPDGTELPVVKKITLVAEPNDIWRATIEVYVRVPQITAEATIVEAPLPAPVDGEQDVTDLADRARRFEGASIDSDETEGPDQ